jgi:hypothetical protein
VTLQRVNGVQHSTHFFTMSLSLSDVSGSGNELSSRHIPGMDTLSTNPNISFSFQIPGTVTGDNLLADEDENDFFRITERPDVSLGLTHASTFSPARTSPACRVERKDMAAPLLPLHEVQSNTPEHEDPPIFSPGLAYTPKPSIRRPKLTLSIRPLIQAVKTSTSPETSFPLPIQEIPTRTVNDHKHPLLESRHNEIQVSDGPETKPRPTNKRVELAAKEQQDRKKDTLRTQRVSNLHLSDARLLTFYWMIRKSSRVA